MRYGSLAVIGIIILVLGFLLNLHVFFLLAPVPVPSPILITTTTPRQAPPLSVAIQRPTQVTDIITAPPETPAPIKTATSSPIIVPVPLPKPPATKPIAKKPLLWGAYVGDASRSLEDFETLVGKKVNFYADFEGWENSFPIELASKVGQQGKTLIVFWEPSFGYDNIIDKSKDVYIKKFAADAKAYGYPVILVPFPEMNLDEEAWGYGQNNNTAAKFQTAWKQIHDIFSEAKNVKFGLAYNDVSIPNVSGNTFNDYYPGNNYVDYVGVDGFNFSNPERTFAQIFDEPMNRLASYGKPIMIFSMGSVAGSGKADWIKKGLGEDIKKYKNLSGWIWFNQGGSPNWLVNSDDESLKAFKSVLP